MRNCNAIPGRTMQNELLGMSLDPKSQHRPHPKMGGLAGDFTPNMHHPKVYLTEVHLWMGVRSIGTTITTIPDFGRIGGGSARFPPPTYLKLQNPRLKSFGKKKVPDFFVYLREPLRGGCQISLCISESPSAGGAPQNGPSKGVLDRSTHLDGGQIYRNHNNNNNNNNNNNPGFWADRRRIGPIPPSHIFEVTKNLD